MATTKLCSCHIVMILSSKCLVYWKQTKKATVQEHCSTIGLPKVIILLLKYDNSFCHYFVMKTLMTWPHFLVNTFKTSRLKLLTTASRIPHYRVKLPHWCIQCYWRRSQPVNWFASLLLLILATRGQGNFKLHFGCVIYTSLIKHLFVQTVPLY